MAAFLLAGAVTLLPIELGYLLLRGRKLNGRCSLQGVVLYRREWGWRYLLLAVGLLVLAIGAYQLTEPLARIWQQRLFGWLPASYLLTDLKQYAVYSRPVLIGLCAAQLVLNGVLFPVAEELYFRGYLLPRMSRMGWAAPLLHCLLFACYHLWQPYSLPATFVVSLPMVLGVWKSRNLSVGIYAHVMFNTVGGAMAMAAVLQRG
jgi:hypothetical protein